MTKYEYKIIKEEHLFTSDEKLKFCGYGEWVEEPDSVQLEYKGYRAIIERMFVREPYATQVAYFGGYLCGYVRIPSDHPLYKSKEIDLDCHQSVTFDEVHEERLIGFDCAHSGDYVPTSEHMRRTDTVRRELKKMFPLPEGFEKFALFNPVYRNIQYCIDQCIGMVDQLIEIRVKASHDK